MDDVIIHGVPAPRTVDAFQGLEADFVIFSTVNVPPYDAAKAPATGEREERCWPFAIGFGRLCVAASRARKQFSWIGNFAHLRTFPKLARVLDDMHVVPVVVTVTGTTPKYQYGAVAGAVMDLD